MSVFEVRGQFQGMNMHEVKGWDIRLEVKMQLKVMHTSSRIDL